ncbi:MAG: helicase-related protein [Candidatus Woesearchaeota archaeon]
MAKESSNDGALEVALVTINEGRQALLFVNSKRSAEKMADDIASKLKPDESFKKISQEAENTLSRPTKQCLRLSRCLKKGIAFHHAGLHQKQKTLIEDNFRDGKIKIICCTPTLAAGMDLPAFRVIIRDLKRYGGHWGMTPIPVLEYLQMAGRAGRPGKEKQGEAISIASTDSEKEEIHETYVRGKPEDIYSKLAVEPVLRTYVLSLVASGFIRNETGLKDFFGKTFWAQQYQDRDKLNTIISRMIDLLERYRFIESAENPSDFVSANEFEEKRLKATPLGRRVAELYLDPLTANHLILNMIKAEKRLDDENEHKRTADEFSILQMISHTIEMMPLLRVKTKEIEAINDTLADKQDFLLEEEPSLYDTDYDEFLSSIKTTLFFMDWIGEKDDEFLLEKYDIRPGETRYKLDKAKWLFYACSEFCKLLSFEKTGRLVRKCELRVKYGVKEELLPLLKLSRIGRTRARKLFNNQIKSLKDIKKADMTTLSFLLGPSIARNIKIQLDQEEKPVKKGTRKGQLSVEKFS